MTTTAEGRRRNRPGKGYTMKAFEETIKEQLIGYRDRIEWATKSGYPEIAREFRDQRTGFLKGLETCLSKKYVLTFAEYIRERH